MRTAGGFSTSRLARLRSTLEGHVTRGDMPGLVTLVSRHGETLVEAIGDMALDGGKPMRRDTIFRIASMTKPVTAAAAMILVEECRLYLDDPVDRWLPELANRRVLRTLGSALDDTVPAKRSITLRDLLTFKLGFGLTMTPPGTYPIQKAVSDAGLAPGPIPPQLTPTAYMKNLGSLPLMHQPGEKWMYHTGSDVLGVLIARASGKTLGAFLRERIFEPLGMKDTGFHVPPEKLSRLPPTYVANQETGKLSVHDDPAVSRWAAPPSFESGGGGLVSTADDYLAFCRMMLDKGQSAAGGERILSRPSVELMTTDHLTPEQKADAVLFFGNVASWGFGMSVCLTRGGLETTPGRFGWDGGCGTSGHSDPAEDMVGILMTQRLMDSPQPPRAFRDFWTLAYQAIDD